MNDPQDWPDVPSIDGTKCILFVDWGNGIQQTVGTAFLTPDGYIVYSDSSGWCTQYVKGWEPIAERPK
jgi:hypothetical protein